MEITAINQTATYQKVSYASRNTAGEKPEGTIISKALPDYKVSLSSKGRQKSLSSFNRSQQINRSTFERGQNADKAANDRQIENERKTFEHKQASEERQFENSQNLKKMRFMREITKNAS